MNTKEAKELYENASEEVKACMDILATMNAEELKDVTLFFEYAREDPEGANWILEHHSQLGGLSFATMIQLAKNELSLDKEGGE